MIVQQFLLLMSMSRILLMIALITWLMFTDADRRTVIRNSVLAAGYMLGSNLINVTLVVGVLKVSPW